MKGFSRWMKWGEVSGERDGISHKKPFTRRTANAQDRGCFRRMVQGAAL